MSFSKLSFFAVFFTVVSLMLGAAEPVCVTVDSNKAGHAVPKTLYGIFYEDIGNASDGGIYPELIANRGFDWLTKELEGWKMDCRNQSAARISRQNGNPIHANTATHIRIEAFGPNAGIRNDGYDGIAVVAGKKYDLSFYARGLDGYQGSIRFLLEKADGTVLAEYKLVNSDLTVGPHIHGALDFELPAFKHYQTVLIPAETVKNAHFSVLLDASGVAELDMISLFPQETFKGRKNGLRADMMEMLKELKPAFVRFPGGCIVEGEDFERWFDWRRTVGALERRTTIWNTWGYWQSMGLGFYEFFQMCEDLEAEPLPIMLSGLTCQLRGPKYAPLNSMDYFAQVVLDLIEFANGETDTPFGKLRADMGHPASFNLKYVGIGNENFGKEFLDRYALIAKTVREKHPEIVLVSSAGVDQDGKNFDMAWNFLSRKENCADLVDEHFYRPSDWILANVNRYDRYDRTAPKVYLGEYACVSEPKNGFYSALCEAAFLTGIERNSDVVSMTSYAPLFGKIKPDTGKPTYYPDMIWFDNTHVIGTANYYVHQLFFRNRPDILVPCEVSEKKSDAREYDIGLITWKTAASFRNLKIVSQDGKVLFEGLPDLSKSQKGKSGNWKVENNVLSQTVAGDATDTLLTFPSIPDLKNFTITLEARSDAGSEGFAFRVMPADFHQSMIQMNYGGWENKKHGIQTSLEDNTARLNGAFSHHVWHKIKITMEDNHMSSWLDGKQLFDKVNVAVQHDDFFAVTGYDIQKKQLVVKCVNLSDTARDFTFDFGKYTPVVGKAERVTISGKANDINDIGNPFRISPVKDSVSVNNGKQFEIQLKPLSLTMFRFDVR